MRQVLALTIAGLSVLAPLLPATDSALPGDWAKNSAVFRGPFGSGFSAATGVPTVWNEEAGKNILWKMNVPLGGLSSPVVWGDLVFVSGATREKREVYCLGAADGIVKWTGTYESSPDASVDYEVYDSLDALMHAAPTPAVDGERVYAMFANGEIAAFDVAKGKFLWSRLLGCTDDNMYGLTGSLLVYRGSVMVQFDGDDYALIRLDGMTGKEIWRKERDDGTWASPVLIKTTEAKYQVVITGDPETSGWDPETGEKLWSHELVSGDIAPSPVYGGELVYVNFSECGIFGIDPTGKTEVKWIVDELEDSSISDANSMATDGKFLYQFHQDMLVCLDARTGDVIYEKMVNDTTSYASPAIIDGKLYLFCGNTTLIVQIGKEFKLLGKCSLDEYTDVSPAVADGRIYIRTAESLYCIGAK